MMSLRLLVLAAGLCLTTAAQGASIKSVVKKIDGKLAQLVKKGHYVGLSVGVVVDQKLLWSGHYGVVDKKSGKRPTNQTLYSIGSITKTFTATLLLQIRDAGKLRLWHPLKRYLPRSVVLPGKRPIRLEHLLTHTSGLPRSPVNMTPISGDPFNSYSGKALLTGLSQTRLDYPVGRHYQYSNLGFGLLGYLLGRQAGTSYQQLLKSKLLTPLNMSGTTINIGPAHRPHLAKGYKLASDTKPTRRWNFGKLEGAGALLSSVQDLARYLALQHRVGRPTLTPISGDSLAELQRVRRLLPQISDGGFRGGIALGWHVLPLKEVNTRVVWHNGGVSGFRSFVGFSPRARIGVIVLSNTQKSVDPIGVAMLKMLLKGRIRPQTVPASRRLREVVQILKRQVRANPGAELFGLFNPMFFHNLPKKKLAALFAGYHAKQGPIRSLKLGRTRVARYGILRARFAKGGRLKAVIGLDAHKSNARIIFLKILKAP